MDKPIYGCIFKAQMSGNMEINVCINVSERLFRHVFFLYKRNEQKNYFITFFYYYFYILFSIYCVATPSLFFYGGSYPPTHVQCLLFRRRQYLHRSYKYTHRPKKKKNLLNGSHFHVTRHTILTSASELLKWLESLQCTSIRHSAASPFIRAN